MSKLRIVFWGPLGFYKGWSALKALEKWALLTHNPVAWNAPKQKRLVQLFECFKPTVPRGTRFGLLVLRERAKLSFHKSPYRLALDIRGFPGRRKRKMPGVTIGGGIAVPQASTATQPPPTPIWADPIPVVPQPPSAHSYHVTFAPAGQTIGHTPSLNSSILAEMFPEQH